MQTFFYLYLFVCLDNYAVLCLSCCVFCWFSHMPAFILSFVGSLTCQHLFICRLLVLSHASIYLFCRLLVLSHASIYLFCRLLVLSHASIYLFCRLLVLSHASIDSFVGSLTCQHLFCRVVCFVGSLTCQHLFCRVVCFVGSLTCQHVVLCVWFASCHEAIDVL